MKDNSITRVKQAFFQNSTATIASIIIGLSFKIWLAHELTKSDLALFNTVIDVILLALILMTGFRSSMVVTYSQIKNDRDIINVFRFSLLAMVLFTWGIVLPYIKYKMHLDISYFQFVAIILAIGLKVYFTNLIAMYRLYPISNKVTWLEPVSNVIFFIICYFLLDVPPLKSLFLGLTLSSLFVAGFMYKHRNKTISTRSLSTVTLNPEIVGFIKKSFIAALEAASSILMIYITILLTVQHFSIDELGDFQVVVRPIFTYLTLLFVFPIYKFVLPELAVCVRNNDIDQIKQMKHWVYKLAVGFSACFFIIMLFFADTIIGFVFSKNYIGAVPVLIHFSVFFVFMMLNAFQLAYIKANGFFLQSLMIRIAGIVTLVSSFYFYMQFTQNVVSIISALGTGYLIMFLFSSAVERKILKGNSQKVTP